MSVQAGIFYFDGRPVAREAIASIGQSLDLFGPDRAGQFATAGLAMIHRALHVTSEDIQEHQPIISLQHNVLTWDGRLDNRADLLAQLKKALRDDISDAAIAMAAYEKWGVEAFARLIGDWSLAVFDSSKRSLFLASDFMGVRPLFYHADADHVSWSSSLKTLVDVDRLHEEIDPYYVAAFVSQTATAGLTPYKRLYSVPPAHYVQVAGDGLITTQRFWEFRGGEIRLSHRSEYEAQLRHLFFEAVGSRLRSAFPVWAQLSGGLDSSCIVCAADHLMKQGSVAAPDFCTVSYISDGSPESDERRFVQCIDEYREGTTHYIQIDNLPRCADEGAAWVTPAHTSGNIAYTYRLVRRNGGRLLLTGLVGDSVMGNCVEYHYDVAGLLQERRLIAAIKLARLRARSARQPIKDILHDALIELLPDSALIKRLTSERQRLLGGELPATDQHIGDLFSLTSLYGAWLREQWTEQTADLLRFPDVSHRRQVSDLLGVAASRQLQPASEDPFALTSHPYVHRPLVDFMLAVPFTEIAPPGHPRDLMRRAFAPFVPERIISRFSKSVSTSFLVRTFRDTAARWAESPESLRLLHLGCFDRPALLRYLDAVRSNATPRLGLLKALVAVERWLAAREQYVGRVPAEITVERR